MEPEELAGAIKRLTEWAEEQAPRPESAVRRRLRRHLGRDPAELPVVSRAVAAWDRPNFQVAIDAWCAGRETELVGLPVTQGYRAGLAELVRGSEWLDSAELGAVEHVTIALGERESITCVQSGLWLVADASGPLVVMLKSEDRGMGESLALGGGGAVGPDARAQRLPRPGPGAAPASLPRRRGRAAHRPLAAPGAARPDRAP